MIQRIQTLWLFVAALLNGGVFCFDFYHATLHTGLTTAPISLRVIDHYPTLIVALIITALPLITMFMFNNRKQQRRMTAYSLIATAGFISTLLLRVGQFNKENPTATDGSYWLGAVLPLISMIMLVLALRGINKDIRLVKSLDRLR